MLKLLDAELALARAKRGRTGASRNAMRIFGIVFILIATVAALAVLQYMATELHERAAGAGKLPAAKPASQLEAR